MEHNEKKFVFDLKSDSFSKLESFVDYICDQLLINETYSGNILVSLTELFNIAKESAIENIINILYTTDYQNINLIVKPIENQIVTRLKEKIKLEDTEFGSVNKSMFLITSLVDRIDFVDDQTINMSFDISAIHNKVYNHRQSTLHSYFEPLKAKLPKAND